MPSPQKPKEPEYEYQYEYGGYVFNSDKELPSEEIKKLAALAARNAAGGALDSQGGGAAVPSAPSPTRGSGGGFDLSTLASALDAARGYTDFNQEASIGSLKSMGGMALRGSDYASLIAPGGVLSRLTGTAPNSLRGLHQIVGNPDPDIALRTTNSAQQFGKVGTDIGVDIAAGAAGAPALASGAVLGALQNENPLVGALTGIVGTGVGKAGSALSKLRAERAPQALREAAAKVLGLTAKDVERGVNPAQEMIDQGFDLARPAGELVEQVGKRLEEVGAAKDEALQAAESVVRASTIRDAVHEVLNPLIDRGGKLAEKLRVAREELVEPLRDKGRFQAQGTPFSAQDLLRQIERVKAQAADVGTEDIAVAKAFQKLERAVEGKLPKDVRELLRSQRNLEAAQAALERKAAQEASGVAEPGLMEMLKGLGVVGAQVAGNKLLPGAGSAGGALARLLMRR